MIEKYYEQWLSGYISDDDFKQQIERIYYNSYNLVEMTLCKYYASLFSPQDFVGINI